MINKKYRVYVNEFQGCMGHCKKSYIECTSLEETKQKAKEIEESDDSHWTTCCVQEGEDRTFTVTKTFWKDVQ